MTMIWVFYVQIKGNSFNYALRCLTSHPIVKVMFPGSSLRSPTSSYRNVEQNLVEYFNMFICLLNFSKIKPTAYLTKLVVL